MYTQFIYKIGGNPYISTNNHNLFKMILKYHLNQFDCKSFVVLSPREWRGAKTYNDKRAVLAAFAQDWQYKFSDMVYDWGSLADWGAFFEEYGKKYGLLREFRENGIL